MEKISNNRAVLCKYLEEKMTLMMSQREQISSIFFRVLCEGKVEGGKTENGKNRFYFLTPFSHSPTLSCHIHSSYARVFTLRCSARETISTHFSHDLFFPSCSTLNSLTSFFAAVTFFLVVVIVVSLAWCLSWMHVTHEREQTTWLERWNYTLNNLNPPNDAEGERGRKKKNNIWDSTNL